MKKILSLALCFACFLSFSFPVSAFSCDDDILNGVELSAMRLSASVAGKNEIQIADEILLSIGLKEEFVEGISNSKKIEIANSSSIQCSKEYSKIDSNGNETILTEETFNKELSLINEHSDEYNNLIIPMVEVPDNGLHPYDEDKYLIKNMHIYETKNAPSGTYGIIVTYEWKNYSVRWQGEDVIAIYGDDIVFDRSSFSFHGLYAYDQTTSIGTNVGQVVVDVDADTLEEYNDLKVKDNGITYQFNLKSNIYSPVAPLIYSQASFMMIASARVAYPTLVHEFNIRTSYFHQKIGFGSLGVSVDINGATVSVSPSFSYVESYLSTEKPITYNSNK